MERKSFDLTFPCLPSSSPAPDGIPISKRRLFNSISLLCVLCPRLIDLPVHAETSENETAVDDGDAGNGSSGIR